MKKNLKYFFFLLISFGVFHAGNSYSHNSILNFSLTKLSDRSLQQKSPCLNNVSTIQDLSFEEDEDIKDVKSKTNLNTSFVLLFSLGERNLDKVIKTSFTQTSHQNTPISKIFILNSVFRL